MPCGQYQLWRSGKRTIRQDHSRFSNSVEGGGIAPETLNNAADQTAFIPTLTVGIPGSTAVPLILGVLIIGIPTEPGIISGRLELSWGLVSFWVGNVLLLILNIPLIGSAC